MLLGALAGDVEFAASIEEEPVANASFAPENVETASDAPEAIDRLAEPVARANLAPENVVEEASEVSEAAALDDDTEARVSAAAVAKARLAPENAVEAAEEESGAEAVVDAAVRVSEARDPVAKASLAPEKVDSGVALSRESLATAEEADAHADRDVA